MRIQSFRQLLSCCKKAGIDRGAVDLPLKAAKKVARFIPQHQINFSILVFGHLPPKFYTFLQSNMKMPCGMKQHHGTFEPI
jgi:hypothetical protein